MLNKKSVIFRVYGTPRPFPKKKIGGHGSHIMTDDYRTRKHPVTGKIQRYDHGYKKNWMMHVQSSVAADMKRLNLKPFPKDHPVALGIVFFIQKPKTNRSALLFPILQSDRDNHNYSIWNALKRTPGTNVRGVEIPGQYPEGVVYYDDNQLVWDLQPQGWVWATQDNPPGVIISVMDANLVYKTANESVDAILRMVEEC